MLCDSGMEESRHPKIAELRKYMLNRPSKAVMTRVVVGVTALLATLVLPLMLNDVGYAQTAETTVMYAENGTDPVLNLAARDPERVTTIYWSTLANHLGTQDLGIFQDTGIDGGTAGDGIDDTDDDVLDADVADDAFFDISPGGALTFKDPPNFEAAAGDGADGDDNEYKVVVQASDGGTNTALNWFKVTVIVTDVEETGTVTWTVDHDGGGVDTPKLMQFQAGASLSASVTDDDVAANVQWQWYRSSSKTSMGTPIDGATSNEYTVSDTASNSDVGMYLRAVATYSDSRGPNKTADLVSDYPVQAARKDNTPPAFASDAATREIPEGAAKRDVGAPVTATDADSDVLNYTLSGTDEGKYEIDQKTGQIKTKLDLDFETETKESDGTVQHEVDVTATDSAGEAAAATGVKVTITVTDLNDKPTFAAGSPKGMAPDHTEGTTGIDMDPAVVGVQAATYTASDPEGAVVTLSLSGDDEDMFQLGADLDPGAAARQVLSFKSNPDFEIPGDNNRDNVYEVTVVASDGEMTAMRSLTVKVTDADEAGTVELSSQDALIGVALTATLKDSDGGVPQAGVLTSVKWSWHVLAAAVDTADSTNTISEATSASYTPVAADRGNYLKAMATYTDRTYDEDNDATNNNAVTFVAFMNAATSMATTAVRNNPDNQAPKFVEGSTAVRIVEENTMADTTDDATDDTLELMADNVGEPITATDADGDTPTYSLSGADAARFRIRSNGQIEVGDKTMLDYETKNRYSLTVTADDGYGGSNSTARITVTIHVTGLDDPPAIEDTSDSSAKAEQSVNYAENGDGPVITLRARDPERVAPIYWSFLTDDTGDQDLGIFQDADDDGDDDSADDVAATDVIDHGLFDISPGGVLTFKSKPNFEAPADDGTNNVYKVVVQASDGGTNTALNWFKVTVTVTDVEETGTVTWTVDHDGGASHVETLPKLMQFQAGASLSASVTDDDGTPANVRWQWHRSSSMTSTGTPIAGATSDEYTTTDSPDPGDVGKYIHVKATYNVDSGTDETAELASDYPVLGIRSEANSAPVFASTDISRRVTEGAKGRAVGAPVTATDADDDVRNYTLGGTDVANYEIDQKTGQIKTKLDLDFETETKETDGTVQHEVEVTATDSAGETSGTPPVTVTITVTDVNDKPTITADSPKGMAADHTEGTTEIDLNPETAAVQAASYTADDPEGAVVTLSLSGDDEGMFQLGADSDTGAAATRVLSFKSAPDFEIPGDNNRDNVYEVTVVASDGVMTAMQSLTVKVTDTDEAGTVGLSSQDALIGVALTATLKDSDGGVPQAGALTNVKWSWHVLAAAVDTADSTNTISKATSASYTPVAADRGMYLKAMATYTDRTYDEDNDATNNTDPTFVAFMNAATSMSTTAVRNNPDNQAPKFEEGSTAVRIVEENTMAVVAVPNEDLETSTDDSGDNVGEPVTATDDADAMPTYSLSGADAAKFRIRSDGQIEVGDKTMLDYETKNSYSLTVTASDSSNTPNNSASITVTIHVTDLDDPPVIVATEGGLSISGDAGVTHAEDAGTAVETYTALGPDAAMATWSVGGDDAGDFAINGGTLSFRSAPNFEAPTDADTDNVYKVTVMASDGTYDAAPLDVTVTVTNAEESGTITLSSDQPVVDVELTATFEDDDGVIAGSETWQWARETDDGSYADIDGATSAAYTPVDDDDGKHLRVTVNYDDGEGDDKSATLTSANPVSTTPAAGDYDANNNGTIDRDEVIQAIRDYFANVIDRDEVIAVIRLYFSS